MNENVLSQLEQIIIGLRINLEDAEHLYGILSEDAEDDGAMLDVVYLSQWGEGADARRGDCGPACVAMLAHYLSDYRPSVDQAGDACGQPRTGSGANYTGHAQLRRGAEYYGFELETRSKYTGQNLTLELLRYQLDEDLPSIALIHYGVLRDETNGTQLIQNQDQNYARGHWVLVVGYDDDGFFIHDPDFWGERAKDGQFRFVPNAAFEAALATVAPGCTVGYQGLVVTNDLF